MPTPKAYQVAVTLPGAMPRIRRRVQVAGDTPLDELHHVIQIAMGWTDSRLHAFRAGRETYGAPDPDFPGDMHKFYPEAFDLEAVNGEPGAL